MGRRVSRSLVIAVSALAMLAQLGLGQWPQASAGTKPAASPPTSRSSSPPSATVTLITGDKVLVQQNGGRQSVVTDAASRGPGTAYPDRVLRGNRRGRRRRGPLVFRHHPRPPPAGQRRTKA